MSYLDSRKWLPLVVLCWVCPCGSYQCEALAVPGNIMHLGGTSQRNHIHRHQRKGLPLLMETSPKDNEISSDDADDKGTINSSSPKDVFETVVQKVTGDDNYQFGDITKKTLAELAGQGNKTRADDDTNTGSDESEDYQYQFGDISKHLVTTVGQTITGREDYQFGDITKQTLQSLEEDLEEWKFKSLTDLPQSIFQTTLGGMNAAQRREVIVAFVRLAAIAVLAWGVVANICTAGVLSVAWMKTLLETDQKHRATMAVAASVGKKGAGVTMPLSLPMIPILSEVNPTIWRTFLAHYATLRLYLDPILLVVKAGGALMLFVPYIQCIESIEKKIPIQWRRRGPLVSRGLALSVAFAINNLLLSGAIGALLMGAGSLFAKLFLLS